MQKKKYLFTTLSLTGGGTERVAAVLPSKLADLGYETHLIVYRKADKEYPISDNLHVHYLQEGWKSGNPLARLQRNVSALREILLEVKPDVTINFICDMSLFQMYLACAGLPARFVATIRNHPKLTYKGEKFGTIKNWINLSLVKRADICFMQTEEQLAFFHESVKKKSFVLSNPVDDSFIQATYPEKDAITKIVTLGRLGQQKNHKLLVEAFAEVKKRMPDKALQLEIYGEGEEKEPLEVLGKELGLQDSMKLCGRTTNPIQTICEHDLFILSSDYEGMPNALMEAMAVGIPCISTDCPTGPADMITNEKNGMLVPMKDVKALADAMEYMMEHPKQAILMGSKGKQYIQKHYTAEVIAQQLVQKIDELSK